MRAAIAAAASAFGWRGVGFLLCVVCVAAAYGTLALYDCFALRTLGHRGVPWRLAALAGFTSYAIGHNVGAATFVGGVVRYRVYSAGLDAKAVAKVCFIAGLTFWLGNAFVLGAGALIEPVALSAVFLVPAEVIHGLAATVLAALAAHVAWVWRRPRYAGIQGFRVSLPDGPLTIVQIGLGAVDLLCCATSLYLVLPGGAARRVPCTPRRICGGFARGLRNPCARWLWRSRRDPGSRATR